MAFLGGCVDTGAPEGARNSHEFVFLPADSNQVINISQFLDFSVETLPQASLSARWFVDGEYVGLGPRYRYFPADASQASLRVEAEMDSGISDEFHWNVIAISDLEGDLVFSPDVDVLQLNQGQPQDFRAFSEDQNSLSFAWVLDGEPVSHDFEYSFENDQVGQYQLEVFVQGEFLELSHQWILLVRSCWNGIHYSPVVPSVSLVETQEKVFRVLGETDTFEIVWTLNDSVVGNTPDFTYRAEDRSLDILSVSLAAFGEEQNRQWEIHVDPLGALPPESPQLTLVDYGPLGGDIVVHWMAPAEGVFPLQEYQVLMSTSGPVETTPPQAQVHLGTVPHLGEQTSYQEIFNTQHGIVAGQQAWFAVVAIDDRGQESPLENSYAFFIEEPWNIRGQVFSAEGGVLAGMQIQAESFGLQTLTDLSGHYTIGPFPPFTQPQLEVRDPGFPITHRSYTTEPISEEVDLVLDLGLFPVLECDPGCEFYVGGFLVYFRHMTRTNWPTEHRPNQHLYSWPQYPLQVWIPEHINEDQVDMRSEAIWSLELWNSQLEEDVFQVVQDSEQAQVVFHFSDELPGANGLVTLLAPGGASYLLGDVVPEKMRVYLNIHLRNSQRVRETALHELGHVLGLVRHAQCSNMGYLMAITSAGALDQGPENAIHPDELAALRLIRLLPQGYDMARVGLADD